MRKWSFNWFEGNELQNLFKVKKNENGQKFKYTGSKNIFLVVMIMNINFKWLGKVALVNIDISCKMVGRLETNKTMGTNFL